MYVYIFIMRVILSVYEKVTKKTTIALQITNFPLFNPLPRFKTFSNERKNIL